jgi:hypothetical protein
MSSTVQLAPGWLLLLMGLSAGLGIGGYLVVADALGDGDTIETQHCNQAMVTLSGELIAEASLAGVRGAAAQNISDFLREADQACEMDPQSAIEEVCGEMETMPADEWGRFMTWRRLYCERNLNVP